LPVPGTLFADRELPEYLGDIKNWRRSDSWQFGGQKIKFTTSRDDSERGGPPRTSSIFMGSPAIGFKIFGA